MIKRISSYAAVAAVLVVSLGVNASGAHAQIAEGKAALKFGRWVAKEAKEMNRAPDAARDIAQYGQRSKRITSGAGIGGTGLAGGGGTYCAARGCRREDNDAEDNDAE